mgnify:CR=1 FL=1
MKEQRAIQILRALVEGTDPLTGEELPSGTVLQQADVLRAMLAGVSALQESIGRASRRASLPRNIGKAWSEEEHDHLVAAFQAGEPIPQIAERHGRTVRAIEARLERHGLIQPSERSTENRFDKSNRKPPSDQD